ncbi:MAG: hypothetical protein IJR13_09160 [Bacteroidales bacterium]|nr:hypothetical protein [Bacteroidales bacterium]
MIDWIRKIYYRFIFGRLLKKERDKALMSYGDIRRILIVFVMRDESSWHAMTDSVQQMEQEGKMVELLAIVPADYHLEFLITRKHTHLLYEEGNFSFWRLPRHDVLSDLYAEHYDVLIDAVGGNNRVAQYISLMSHAAWRIAYHDRSAQRDEAVDDFDEEIYDLIISESHPISFKEYMKSIEQYMRLLRS